MGVWTVVTGHLASIDRRLEHLEEGQNALTTNTAAIAALVPRVATLERHVDALRTYGARVAGGLTVLVFALSIVGPRFIDTIQSWLK